MPWRLSRTKQWAPPAIPSAGDDHNDYEVPAANVLPWRLDVRHYLVGSGQRCLWPMTGGQPRGGAMAPARIASPLTMMSA
jgi:hypothetical protein